MTPIHTIAIVGAGAMGCLFAARLAAAGHAVTVIDVDDARLAALGGQGITLADDDGTRTVPVGAARAAAVAGPVDLVILFTKGMHSAAAIRSVAHLAGPETLALTLQNGLGNAETIAAVWNPARILIGATDFPADLVGPTHVASHGAGHIWLGAFAGGGDDAVAAVVAALRAGGLDAVADPDVLVSIWEKVAFNAALNALATITGLTVGGMDTPAGRRIAMAVVDETVATAAAEGLTLDRAGIAAKIDHALAHHRGHKASMLQDRLAGRATEIETINGAIVARAAAAGVPTPVTATLADLVRLIEAPGIV
ncbi:MAG: 2-dehydropantoate 2-reductase [Sphingomonas fennica]